MVLTSDPEELTLTGGADTRVQFQESTLDLNRDSSVEWTLFVILIFLVILMEDGFNL